MTDLKRLVRGLIFLTICATVLVSCKPGTSEDESATTPTATEENIDRPDGETSSSELAGTSWRLLNIQGMDDSLDVPDDPSRYTLAFGNDGSAAMQADCNRGAGTWVSESAGQLQFGPVVSTRALCPEGSLSEKYLAQFEWVRSYVMKEGHLFLATMADGAIIEFEPAPDN